MILFIIFIILSFLLFYASYSIEAGVYVKSFCRNKRGGRVVSLTFDDGVEPLLTEKVLDVLKKYDVKATFFVIGSKVEKYPEIVRRIIDEGHLVGNHSYSHSSIFPLKSSKKIVEELVRTNNILRDKCGVNDVRYFRPPFGVTNPNIAKAIKNTEFESVGWSIRSFDTNIKSSREKVARRVLSKLKNGSVILLHDIVPDSDLLLELIICGIKGQKYKIERLDRLKNK